MTLKLDAEILSEAIEQWFHDHEWDDGSWSSVEMAEYFLAKSQAQVDALMQKVVECPHLHFDGMLERSIQTAYATVVHSKRKRCSENWCDGSGRLTVAELLRKVGAQP